MNELELLFLREDAKHEIALANEAANEADRVNAKLDKAVRYKLDRVFRRWYRRESLRLDALVIYTEYRRDVAANAVAEVLAAAILAECV